MHMPNPRHATSGLRLCARSAQAVLVLLGLLLALAACGADGRYVMVGSARMPSTSGIVELEELDGGSTLVTIHLEFLHPPRRARPDATTYVAWFHGPVGSPVRAGELLYNPETRIGELTATAPWPKLTIRITAESEPEPSKPSETVIASQAVEVED